MPQFLLTSVNDPNQHLKDFLKLVVSLNLDVANRERTRLRLFQFSLRDQASNWLERLPAGSISTWEDLTTRFLAQFFPPRRTAKLHNDILMFQQHQGESLSEAWTRFKDLLQKCEIDRAAGGKLGDKNADESWEIFENLALYDHEGWNDSKDFPQALETTFEAQVRDYMAAHAKRIERFENAIFKQREEINDRMTDMFGLLKELTTSRAPKRELIKEEARYPITKNINSISLIKGEGENNVNNNATSGNSIERPDGSDVEVLINKFEKENKAKNRTKNKPIKSAEKEPTQVKEEESVEAPSSQPVGYYLKHMINEKPIEGLVEIIRGDGVANFKRWSQDFQSDDVIDLTMVSGRSRLKVALEDSTWRRRHEYNTTPLRRFSYIYKTDLWSATAHAASGSARKNLSDVSSDDEVFNFLTTSSFALRLICLTSSLLGGARTKDVVDGHVDTPSRNVDHPQSSIGVDPFAVGPSSAAPGIAGDDIERDFFPFVHVPTRLTIRIGGLIDPSVCKAVVDHFPTSTEVVRVETLTDEQLTKKVSALHCVMISHGDKLLARP
ncbi:zinc finger, CCHC-type containing protein [Tanacetum coccineum]